MLYAILITGLIIGLVTVLILDYFYLRRFNQLWRVMAMIIILSCPILLAFGLETLLNERITWYSFFYSILLILILGIVISIANYIGNRIFKFWWRKIINEENN